MECDFEREILYSGSRNIRRLFYTRDAEHGSASARSIIAWIQLYFIPRISYEQSKKARRIAAAVYLLIMGVVLGGTYLSQQQKAADKAEQDLSTKLH